MAKKPKFFLEYKFNAEFSVRIDPNGRETLLADVNRGEVALPLNYKIGDDRYSINVYSDGIKGGDLIFNQTSDDALQIALSGSYFQNLDPKWEQDIIDMWQSMGDLKVYTNQVCDSQPTSHYINGSDDAFEIGTVSFVEK